MSRRASTAPRSRPPGSACGVSKEDRHARQNLFSGSTEGRAADRRRGDREAGAGAEGAARAPRAAVLPRRGRQRRQLRPRGQRFPQAVRHRGVRADRQRVGAHRAHQRRGLGDDLRRLDPHQPRRRERRGVRLLRRRRESGEERQPQHRRRAEGSEGARHEDLRRGWPRWRLHEEGRRLRDRRADGGRQPRHAAHRSISGGGVALPRLASGPPANSNEVVSRRAVFLDRDGVINAAIVRDGKPYAPLSLDEMRILDGVPQALAQLRAAGYLNVLVTNQPDVANGKTTRAVVEQMHSRLVQELPIDAVKVCFHDDADNCGCRKPKPGMLLEAARELGIDMAKSYLVGDRWRDVAAAQAAGCKALFIDYSYRERQPDLPYVRVKSLPDAAAFITRNDR